MDSLSAIQVLLVGRVGGKIAHFLYLLPSQRNAIISHTLYFTNHAWILSLAFWVGVLAAMPVSLRMYVFMMNVLGAVYAPLVRVVVPFLSSVIGVLMA